MFSCFEYTAFLWKAKGRHGTHSPFAYWLVDKVARQNTAALTSDLRQLTSNKTRKFIAKLKGALAAYQLVWHPIQNDLSQLNVKEGTPAIYLFSEAELPLLLAQLDTYKFHPDSMLILLDLHKLKNKSQWNLLISNPCFHFTADAYFFGLLSLKPGQAKQHFFLKLA